MAQKPVVQVPVDMVWHWQDEAACRDSDVSTFFHPSNERGRERTTRERAAKAICLACSVRPDCADYAIRSREPYGVWGGLTEGEREAMIGRGLSTRFDRAVSA